VPALFSLDVAKPRLMLADKGYDGDEVRQSLLLRGILPVIPPKANRKEPIACDFKSYKDRNRIERMFNRLKQFRRVATRYDKTSKSFQAFLNLAAAKLWLPTFVNRT
jgi:transposase